MHWYEKLNEYFPIHEMKSQEHMETLLEEKGDIYQKDEGPHHVLMYVEDTDYIFIDYLFVSNASRGQGIGKKLINMLQEKQKPILLEVEPIDKDDKDSVRRLKFYKREGFNHASMVSYRRRSLATNEISPMEILYWAPIPRLDAAEEEEILNYMKRTYQRIHTYKDKLFYGKMYQPVDEVLTLKSTPEEDILKSI